MSAYPQTTTMMLGLPECITYWLMVPTFALTGVIACIRCSLAIFRRAMSSLSLAGMISQPSGPNGGARADRGGDVRARHFGYIYQVGLHRF